jgi:hypothetical protein
MLLLNNLFIPKTYIPFYILPEKKRAKRRERRRERITHTHITRERCTIYH